MSCSRDNAIRLEYLCSLLDCASFFLALSACISPTWIVQEICTTCPPTFPVSYFWNSQISTGLFDAGYMPNPYDVTLLYPALVGWSFSNRLLSWNDLTTENVCNPETAIYKLWSLPYGICMNSQYTYPSSFQIGQALSILAVLFCFLSLFFGVATPATNGFSYAAASSTFAVFAMGMSLAAVCYMQSMPYIRQHLGTAIGVTPILAISSDGIQQQVLPIPCSMNYGYAFIAMAFVFIFEFFSAIISWGAAASLKNRPKHDATHHRNHNDERHHGRPMTLDEYAAESKQSENETQQQEEEDDDDDNEVDGDMIKDVENNDNHHHHHNYNPNLYHHPAVPHSRELKDPHFPDSFDTDQDFKQSKNIQAEVLANFQPTDYKVAQPSLKEVGII